jgi:cytochrome c556
MRWPHFILILSLLGIAVVSIVYLHRDRVVVLKKPPASLAQWYKPQNKRQVWLHNMFKLRREVQAVRFYAERQDAARLEKWADRLVEHYRKIGEMVPEWKHKLDRKALAAMRAAVAGQQYAGVTAALDELDESCTSCHRDYRAVTASLYRAPDFSSLRISPTLSYQDHMQELVRHVNAIKIAAEDGVPERALAALAELQQGMQELGKTCVRCHKKGSKAYPGKANDALLAELAQSLRSGTVKEQGRALGTLAVQACASCHGTHRLAFDVRQLFGERPDWRRLFRH